MMENSEEGPNPCKLPKLEITEEEKNDSNCGADEKPYYDGDLPKEADVGICLFRVESSSVPVHALIKHRYSDFIVQEIDNNGRVAELTSTQLPEQDTKVASKEEFQFTDSQRACLAATEKNGNKGWVTLMEAPESKEDRTTLHKAIKQSYNLESKTSIENDVNCICIKSVKGQSARNYRTDWVGKGIGDYCSFVLYKEGLSTMEAIDNISRYLNLSSKLFNFSGTKDKRGITTQHVTAHKVPASTLARVNAKFTNVKLCNFGYTSVRCGLGDCQGNRFKLVLRKVDNIDLLEDRVKKVKEEGFINYFGMQRFGTSSVPTYKVGQAILKNDWEDVIKLVLYTRSSDGNDNLKPARREVEKGRKYEKALGLCRRCSGPEKSFLMGLAKFGDKNEGAISSAFGFVPRSMRLMYLHSLQSLLWNQLVSKRIQKLGFKVAIGDLVLNSDENPISVSESNISQHSLKSLVIPLPGFASLIPDNLREEFDEMMKSLGLKQEDFKHKMKEYALKGDYRKMICVPKDLEYSMVDYAKDDDDIVKPLAEIDGDADSKGEPDGIDIKGNKALVISFSLGTSSYATMLLRELTRSDTSKQSLKSLGAEAAADSTD